MKLQYLGTAAAEAVPALFCECEFCEEARRRGDSELRLRSGSVLNDRILIDFPPDVYESCRRHKVDLRRVTDVVITHNHGDHLCVNELGYRFAPAYCIRSSKEKMRVWGTDAVRREIDAYRYANEVWEGCEFHEIRYYEPFEVSGVTFTALPANHMQAPPKDGEPFVPNSPDTPCVYLVEQNGRRLLYLHDTGIPFDEVFDYLKGIRLDAVSLDCTCAELRCRHGHMGILEDAEVVERLKAQGSADGETRFFANHFSHNGLRGASGTLYTREVLYAACAGHGIVPSYDGMTFTL